MAGSYDKCPLLQDSVRIGLLKLICAFSVLRKFVRDDQDRLNVARKTVPKSPSSGDE